MKYILIFSALIGVCFSCRVRNAVEGTNRDCPFFNTYKLFEEPGYDDIYHLKFYMLIVDNRLFGTRMISIRQDSNSVYGYNKDATFEQMPSMRMVIDSDSATFRYTTTRFRLSVNDIDTLRSWIGTSSIGILKDSIDSNHLDGGMIEIIIYDGQKSYNVYQTYGSKNELNPSLRVFIERVQGKYRR
jgi:hypothetical protein